MLFEYKGIKPKLGNNVFVAPTASVIGDVEIEEGASIWYGAVLRGDLAYIKIGKNTNIQDNCTIHTDTDKPAIIGDNVTVGHNAVVHGCTVENNCLIGMNAVILNDAVIKTGSVIAAGSVVREGDKIGPRHFAVGIPALFKKELPENGSERFNRPVNVYLRLAKGHKEETKFF